jgi:hypothetical protein
MKTGFALLLALTVTVTSATAGQRCRSTTMGSTTWTTCEGPQGKTECRASRSGKTVYTSCR